jgi:hypothetical protein
MMLGGQRLYRPSCCVAPRAPLCAICDIIGLFGVHIWGTLSHLWSRFRGVQMVSLDSQHTCAICNGPIDLQRDRYTDEDGKAVHERCYMQRLASAQNDPPAPHHTE